MYLEFYIVNREISFNYYFYFLKSSKLAVGNNITINKSSFKENHRN